MNRFIPVDRHTDYLLPPSVDDWLPNDHLARFLVDGVVWLNPVVICVNADILEQRGRENANAIRRRLDRAPMLGELDHPRRMIIGNNGPLDLAAGHLVDRVADRRSECS